MDKIELKNVTYYYPLSKQKALDNISFTFEKGKFYGIIGENGGGKTTLCNLLRGLIPNFYKGKLSGDVFFDGKNLKDIDVDSLSVDIGYVFQNPFTQISGIKKTVFEEIALGLENLGISPNLIIEKVVDILDLLKISNLALKNPTELSGGQRQRVAFASIVVMEPDILVIDEPTSQLDPKGTADIFFIINKLKEKGKTIILVEHKISFIAEYCDEVLIIKEGKLVKSGKTQNVLSDKNIIDFGILPPQATLLGYDLKKENMELDYIPITKEDCCKLIKKKWSI